MIKKLYSIYWFCVTVVVCTLQEVKDTLDKAALYRCMTQCYEMHQAEKPKFEGLVNTHGGANGYLKSAKSLATFGGNLISGVMVCTYLYGCP